MNFIHMQSHEIWYIKGTSTIELYATVVRYVCVCVCIVLNRLLRCYRSLFSIRFSLHSPFRWRVHIVSGKSRAATKFQLYVCLCVFVCVCALYHTIAVFVCIICASLSCSPMNGFTWIMMTFCNVTLYLNDFVYQYIRTIKSRITLNCASIENQMNTTMTHMFHSNEYIAFMIGANSRKSNK